MNETEKTPELTPKVKAEFEEWYERKCLGNLSDNWFPCDSLPFEMQQGVYLAFFRERGMDIWACPTCEMINEKRAWAWCIFNIDIGTSYPNPTAALIAGIEAAAAKLEQDLGEK